MKALDLPSEKIPGEMKNPKSIHLQLFSSCNFFPTCRPPPKRMLPQSSMLPISQPVKSAKYNVSVVNAAVDETTSSAATSTNSTTPQMHAKHDLVVWFEVLELGEK